MVDENAPLIKTSLINKSTLIVLAITIVVLLLILLPNRNVLLGYLDDAKEPEVAIAFLEALDDKDEIDLPILLSLAVNYNKAGRHQDVLNSVIPFDKFTTTEDQWTAKRLYADSTLKMISLAQKNDSKPTSDVNKIKKEELTLFINQLHSIPTKELARSFADIALQAGEPLSALFILKQFKDEDIAENSEFINIALQSGELDYALMLQTEEHEKQPTDESLSKLLDLYLANSSWKAGETAILSFDKGQKLSEEYFTSSINFLLSGGRLGLASTLAMSRADLFPSETNVEHASRLFAQKGDIKQAILFLEKAISYTEKEEYLVTLHQYNRWLGDPKEALRITHLLEKFDLNEKQIRDGIDEASAISNLNSMGHFYHMLGQKGMLLVNEYDKWLVNAEKAIGSTKVIKQLEGLIKNAKANSPLYKQLAKFYVSVGEFEKVGQLWDKIGHITPMSFRNVNYYAEAYRKMWQPEKSLAVLTSVTDLEKADEDYLEEISSLAWYVSDKNTLKKVYKLRKAETIDPYHFIKLHSPIEMSNSKVFYDFYKSTGDLNVLKAFANAALNQNDDKKFEEAMNLAQQREGGFPSSFFILKAQYAIKHNMFGEAQTYLTQVLAEDDTDINAVNNLIWLNIRNKDNKALSATYQEYKNKLAHSPTLWSSFAAASNTLGLHEEAKVWYIKKINNNKQVPAELLDFANVLDNLGDKFSANIIRKHVATNLTKELLKLPNGDRTYRSLASIFIGESTASTMVEQALKEKPTQNKVQELLSYYLGEDNHQKVRLLLQSKWLKDYDLPDNQSLKLALLEHDPERVLELVNSSLFLTPAERIAALNKTGNKEQAWNMGNTFLNQSSEMADHSQLLSELFSLHDERVYALRLNHKSYSQWDIKQNEIGYYRPYGDGFLRFYARQLTSEVSRGILRNTDFKANQFEGNYSFATDTLTTQITALIDHRFSKTSVGAQINTTYNFSKYLSFIAELSKNMEGKISRNMMMFGKKDAISASVLLKPTDREMLTTKVSYQEYKTIFGDSIADNLSVTIKAQETIFYNDPSWVAYVQYVYEKANGTNRQIDRLAEHLSLGNSVSSRDFIANRYEQLSIGQHFSYGAAGTPGVTSTYPSYWLDTSVGYNFRQDKVVFDLSAGIGLPIIGDDELYMSTLWQSADRTGRKNINLSLGYYLTF